MGVVQSQIIQPKNGLYIAYIIRLEDSALLDYSDMQFIPNVKLHLTLDEESRSRYRIPYLEIRPGSYSFNVDCSEFLDGKYYVDTRPINAGIEYPTVDSFYFDIVDGSVVTGSLNVEIESAPGVSLFCFVRRNIDSRYLKAFGDTEFSLLDIPGDSEEYRSQFRIPFVERTPGKYYINRSLIGFDDGVYVATVYRLTAQGVEVKSGSPVTIHVLDERQDRGVLYDTIYLNHDIIENDNLRYVKPNGEPIENASISVFLAAEYQSDVTSNPVGTTYTTIDGRWASAIPVKAGVSYTIVLHKAGYFGPDSITIAL